jgi:UDP-N-acetylglucosamine--N-acetylmuramyl-(pentapeptide) pyrophosphoryl-undecaprenol N-acetylglucosamine transferase
MMKGGYVCVPIGIAAKRLGYQFFTHDSDVTSGLANRIIAKWAYLHARGMPLSAEQQSDPSQVFTGIPLQDAFHPKNQKTQDQYKDQLGLAGKKIIFVVGGGLGARNVNRAVVAFAKHALSTDKNKILVHITGKQLYEETKQMYESSMSKQLLATQVMLLDFTTELHVYAGAADVVVTRAGATNLAEFAALGKACIVVPNPVLTGGQQLHNASVFAHQDAVVVVREEELGTDLLQKTIEQLLNDLRRQAELSKNIKKLARADAASVLADMLIQGVVS